MTWTIETIEQYLKSQENSPYEYNYLITSDPVGRLWKGMRQAEADYAAALQEHRELGAGVISSDATRTSELEGIMTAALSARDTTKAALESACVALGSSMEPSTRSLQSRAAYLRRTRQGGDAASLDALCASLEGIALAAGV